MQVFNGVKESPGRPRFYSNVEWDSDCFTLDENITHKSQSIALARSWRPFQHEGVHVFGITECSITIEDKRRVVTFCDSGISIWLSSEPPLDFAKNWYVELMQLEWYQWTGWSFETRESVFRSSLAERFRETQAYAKLCAGALLHKFWESQS